MGRCDGHDGLMRWVSPMTAPHKGNTQVCLRLSFLPFRTRSAEQAAAGLAERSLTDASTPPERHRASPPYPRAPPQLPPPAGSRFCHEGGTRRSPAAPQPTNTNDLRAVRSDFSPLPSESAARPRPDRRGEAAQGSGSSEGIATAASPARCPPAVPALRPAAPACRTCRTWWGRRPPAGAAPGGRCRAGHGQRGSGRAEAPSLGGRRCRR